MFSLRRLGLATLLLLCGCDLIAPFKTDALRDADADGDADVDGDTDVDGDMDGDTDVDGDGDTDVDGDSDLDGDGDTDADGDGDTDVDGDEDEDVTECQGRVPLLVADQLSSEDCAMAPEDITNWSVNSTRVYDTTDCLSPDGGGHACSSTTPGSWAPCIIRVNSFRIESSQTLSVRGTRPLVIVAESDIEIIGTLFAGGAQPAPNNQAPGGGRGGLTGDEALGDGALGAGSCSDRGTGGSIGGNATAGGGGGSHAGAGGNGGACLDGAFGSGGQPSCEGLGVHLQGGTGGGAAPSSVGGGGGRGGGAVALYSPVGITINGTIDVSGEHGHTGIQEGGPGPGGGGGGGGTILLEAPSVEINGSLVSRGGDGGRGLEGGVGGGAGAPTTGGLGGGDGRCISEAQPGTGGGGGAGVVIIRHAAFGLELSGSDPIDGAEVLLEDFCD